MAPLLQQAVRRNIERKCAQQLQDLSNEFRRGHNNFLKKLKGQEIEDFRPDLKLGGGGGAGTSGGGGGGFFDDEPAEGQVDPRFNAAQTLQLVMAEQMTEERERAINQVASSVTELAEIFKEIQVLVIDQGTILDRIDYNIEQAADRVTSAVVELNKANEYDRSRVLDGELPDAAVGLRGQLPAPLPPLSTKEAGQKKSETRLRITCSESCAAARLVIEQLILKKTL